MSGEMVDDVSSDGRVFRKGGGAGLTLAQAAKRAIEPDGASDGQHAPADVNRMTKASVAALTGQGLVAAARDPARDREPPLLAA